MALSQNVVGLVVDPRDLATVILGSPSFALQNRARARLHWEIGPKSVAEQRFAFAEKWEKGKQCQRLYRLRWFFQNFHLLSPHLLRPCSYAHCLIDALFFFAVIALYPYSYTRYHSLYQALIYTSTMALHLVVPNPEPKCPRNDRLQEAPSAKNAQGLFPPEACIFVGKYDIDLSEHTH